MTKDREFGRRLGRVIKLLGKATGVPMTKLADELKMSYSALNARLAGETEFTAAEVAAIAQFFEVGVEVLYGDPARMLSTALPRPSGEQATPDSRFVRTHARRFQRLQLTGRQPRARAA